MPLEEIARKFDTRKKAVIAAIAANFFEPFGNVAPKGYPMVALSQQSRQRCAPGARANDGDVHVVGPGVAGVFFKLTRVSVPAMRRLMSD